MIIHEKTEEVRDLAYTRAVAFQQETGEDCELDFYDAARTLGLSDRDAETVTCNLNTRAMRARGGI
jgi:hypothetical protein